MLPAEGLELVVELAERLVAVPAVEVVALLAPRLGTTDWRRGGHKENGLRSI